MSDDKGTKPPVKRGEPGPAMFAEEPSPRAVLSAAPPPKPKPK